MERSSRDADVWLRWRWLAHSLRRLREHRLRWRLLAVDARGPGLVLLANCPLHYDSCGD